ncbi:hypothetical protein [Bailinhaonella thermotolerans]|uniref:Uncharacterized protein n=1 Tax=Bailinhaonella thermotolerans TaxID=1070861 RepID=A0A3A4AS42_9ACTN|nr:hypothetical protein [Bailinhaonella thermotolerans]RJL30114.1 hypothetical protein D5H75_24650 [Bailinhaonella thermotolerans]
MPSTKSRLIALAALASAVTVPTAGAAAAADAPPAADAPHAQVAGVIHANGAIKYAKNIVSVSRPAVGVYCVHTNMDVTRTVPSATPWYTGRIVSASVDPSAQCGNRTDTVRVVVTDSAGRRENSAFSLILP